MKLIISLLAVLLIFGSYCKKDNTTVENTLRLNDTLEIGQGQTLVYLDKNMLIYLDSVIQDSRCPKDVVCFWEGNASLRFVFTNGPSQMKFLLNTHSDSLTETRVLDCRIKLCGLTPYPDSIVKIKQEDYKAKIIITDK